MLPWQTKSGCALRTWHIMSWHPFKYVETKVFCILLPLNTARNVANLLHPPCYNWDAFILWDCFVQVDSTWLTYSQVVHAQQEPIYVPFEWNGAPLTASTIGSSGGTTTFAIIDGQTRRLRSATPPPGMSNLNTTTINSTYFVTSSYSNPRALRSIHDLRRTYYHAFRNMQPPVARCHVYTRRLREGRSFAFHRSQWESFRCYRKTNRYRRNIRLRW